MLKIIKTFTLLFLLLLPALAISSDEITGIGKMAENILLPINIVSDFLCTASIIVGCCALFGAAMKYLQYRVNPLIAPLSTIIILLIVGVMLLCLPFVYKLTENGIPYSLLS